MPLKKSCTTFYRHFIGFVVEVKREGTARKTAHIFHILYPGMGWAVSFQQMTYFTKQYYQALPSLFPYPATCSGPQSLSTGERTALLWELVFMELGPCLLTMPSGTHTFTICWCSHQIFYDPVMVAWTLHPYWQPIEVTMSLDFESLWYPMVFQIVFERPRRQVVSGTLRNPLMLVSVLF